MKPNTNRKPDEFDKVIGMKTEEAVAFIKAKEIAVRISRDDDKVLALTYDYISDRINLEVKKGKVIKYHRG